MNKKSRLFLYIGSTLFISIGGYHIFMPYIWGWKEFSKMMPDMIEWALYAVNFFMSSLMILIGVFTIMVVKKKRDFKGNLIILLGGVYWVINFVYQLVNPTPIPPELFAMKVGFLVPPVIGAICYFIPYFNGRAFDKIK